MGDTPCPRQGAAPWIPLFRFIQTVGALGAQTWRLAQLVPAGSRGEVEEAAEKSFPALELPWTPDSSDYSWLNVAERMDAGIRLWLVSLWEELRSIDIVLDEVAREFDGEDPLRPVMRAVVEKTRKMLMDLHEVLSAARPLELKEPDEEAMDLARTFFENGRRLMASL